MMRFLGSSKASLRFPFRIASRCFSDATVPTIHSRLPSRLTSSLIPPPFSAICLSYSSIRLFGGMWSTGLDWDDDDPKGRRPDGGKVADPKSPLNNNAAFPPNYPHQPPSSDKTDHDDAAGFTASSKGALQTVVALTVAVAAVAVFFVRHAEIRDPVSSSPGLSVVPTKKTPQYRKP